MSLAEDLEMLGAEDVPIVGARPPWADTLSPGAMAEFNKQVSAFYDKGMKPDDVDRQMASYGPSYFEGKAKAAAPRPAPAPARAAAVRAAGGAAVAAKGCAADGDPQAWLLLLACLAVLCVIYLGALHLRRGADEPR